MSGQPERTVEFLLELLHARIEKDEQREKEWRKLDAREARKFRKNVDKYMVLLAGIADLQGSYDYKHGIGK